jgi:hypothetical protein
MAFEALGGFGVAAEDEQALAAEIAGGERLLWAGHPRRGPRLVPGDVFAIPFSLFWCGFALFWEKSVWTAKGPSFFTLWGLPFVAIGVYLVLGRFFYDAFRRSKITYGLTPRRLIIRSGVWSRAVKSIDLASLGEISLSERNDKSGTILLGPAGAGALTSSWPGTARQLPPMLETIANARAVYDRIRAAREDAGKR